MGEYKLSGIADALGEWGEVVVVLESGIEYELHKQDTELYETSGMVQTEGMRDGEYQVVNIPVEAIEHTYTHKQN
jgi:hypothetical protein